MINLSHTPVFDSQKLRLLGIKKRSQKRLFQWLTIFCKLRDLLLWCFSFLPLSLKPLYCGSSTCICWHHPWFGHSSCHSLANVGSDMFWDTQIVRVVWTIYKLFQCGYANVYGAWISLYTLHGSNEKAGGEEPVLPWKEGIDN